MRMSEKQIKSQNNIRKRIAVTGANGVVGRALRKHLDEAYDIVSIDLPDINILTDHDKLVRALTGSEAIVHLAEVFETVDDGKDHWQSPHRDERSEMLLTATLTAAKQAGVNKFIHASSIHVEDTMGHLRGENDTQLHAAPGEFSTQPASGYGHSKREQEATLESESHHFKGGAVSIRLGGVRPDNLPLGHDDHPDPEVVAHEQKVWIEHSELADLVGRIIEYDQPIGYDVVYAVSDNDGKFHDTDNKYGWHPTANSADSL